jgi:NAD(P)-dependent dehydrogenase (short-subunit alcohol dehydrogenase family)
MAEVKKVVIVGGTQGLGFEIAAYYAAKGAEVVVTGRDLAKAQAAAKQIGGATTAVAFDLSRPETIGPGLASVTSLDGLVMAAVQRDENTARHFDVPRATQLVMLKLVGYLETIHTLLPRFPASGGAIVLFGGTASLRPFPGSTTVSTVNGGISGMMHSLAAEIAPVRVNALHPGVVDDSPHWREKTEALERLKTRTPGGRPLAMRDIIGAVAFLLENDGVDGQDLIVDNGRMVM